MTLTYGQFLLMILRVGVSLIMGFSICCLKWEKKNLWIAVVMLLDLLLLWVH